LKSLKNPFVDLDGYNCFGCAPHNPVGLRLHFTEEQDEIVSTWNPGINYQGYLNILHGGIQATLMDEIASWTVYIKVKAAGFTAKAEIHYRKQVEMNSGPVTLRSRVKQMRRNLADIEVKLYNSEQILCSEGLLTFFTYSPERAGQTIYFPDPQEFYGEPDK